MTDIVIPRRKFLTGLIGIVAAPAVVRASSLMPVKGFISDGIALTAIPHPISRPIMDIKAFYKIVSPGLRSAYDSLYEVDSTRWELVFQGGEHD